MTSLAPTLEAYFTDRLIRQRRASSHTIASYRDTFRLLLAYIHQTTGTPPSRLEITDLDAATIGAFLQHLEQERGNTARTRNIRLAAIHSFFHYCALRHPEHAALTQRVLAIPRKRGEKRIVTFLTPVETQALLDAPNRSTWAGRRDHALLLTAVQTGLRISELLGRHPRRHAARHRRARPDGRQRQKGEGRAADQADRRGAPRLAPRNHRPAGRSAVSLARWRHAHPRRDRAAPRPTCQDRAGGVPGTAIQAGHDAHVASHRGDEPADRRRRYLHDRAVARTRAGTHHAHLPARRPRAQAAHPGPDDPSGGPPRPLSRPDSLLAFLEGL